MPKLFAKTCWIIEFQAGLCLYVTAAVQAGLTPQRGQSDQSHFEVRWNPSQPWVHIQHVHSNEASFPRSLE